MATGSLRSGLDAGFGAWLAAVFENLSFRKLPLMEVSRDIEELLLQHAPSIVTAARGFASEVVFIPVTATGRSPVVAGSDSTGRVDLRFDPSQIAPRWVELPVFYALHRAGLRNGNSSLIPAAASATAVPVSVSAKNNGRKERGP